MDLFKPFLVIPESSMALNLDGWITLPMFIWSVILLALSILPLILLSARRAKG